MLFCRLSVVAYLRPQLQALCTILSDSVICPATAFHGNPSLQRYWWVCMHFLWPGRMVTQRNEHMRNFSRMHSTRDRVGMLTYFLRCCLPHPRHVCVTGIRRINLCIPDEAITGQHEASINSRKCTHGRKRIVPMFLTTTEEITASIWHTKNYHTLHNVWDRIFSLRSCDSIMSSLPGGLKRQVLVTTLLNMSTIHQLEQFNPRNWNWTRLTYSAHINTTATAILESHRMQFLWWSSQQHKLLNT